MHYQCNVATDKNFCGKTVIVCINHVVILIVHYDKCYAAQFVWIHLVYNNLLTFIYCMYIAVCLLIHALGACA